MATLPAVATMHIRRATVRLLFAGGTPLGHVDHDLPPVGF